METKRAKVIMLPTDKATRGSNIFKTNNGFRYQTVLEDANIKEFSKSFNSWIPQHLYFITEEVIKEGDWFLHNKIIKQCKNNSKTANKLKSCKKIVATTDVLPLYKAGIEIGLFLPQPSQAFIEKYCELGGIDEVLIEYEIDGLFPYKIKIDSHNTITIHPIKDSWTKEEHCTDMQYYMEYCKSNDYVTPKEWLSKYKHY